MPVGSNHSRRLARIGLVAVLVFVCAQAGCTRRFFRKAADHEVEGILTEKNCYEDWRIEQFHVYPDSRARYADPSNPDRPPMPPDDAAARCLSPNPQRPRNGINSFEGTEWLKMLEAWDTENRTNRPAARPDEASIPGLVKPPKSPNDVDRLKTNEKAYLLTVEQACELALLNSREFQDRREDLFLAALPVTLERFAFACQFLAAEEVVREYTGSQTLDGQGNRWRSNSTLGLNKLFPTGALLVFRLANQVVVNMSDVGGPRVVTPAALSLDLTQPLLRGGGFPATLEPLTQVERNLLYVIRGYAHFRKEFYVFIAGSGIFGANFAPTGPLAPSGTAANEGYYLTVLRGALLENARLNVRYLESIRALFGALLTGGDVSQLQVDQVELDLLNGRASVLLQTQQVRDSLDRFKIQLGVPTNLPIELDDASLRPLITQQGRFFEVVSEFDEIRGEISRSSAAIEPEQLRTRLLKLAAEAPLVQGTRFAEDFPRRWRELELLSDKQIEDRVKAFKLERQQLHNDQTDLQLKGKPEPEELRARLAQLEKDLDLTTFEKEVRDFLAKPWLGAGDPTRQEALRTGAYRSALSAFVVVLGEARNERIELVKQRWPQLPATRLCDVDLIAADFDEATATVSQAALSNRLDLMNARARVVDSWRQVAVRANSLMGVLDVRYHMDTATPAVGTQPFDFDGSRTRHQLAMNGELPLVRKAERNEYRTALIAFQRSRRTLQAAEDLVLFSVRSELRQLRVLSEQYKIQQRAVELSYYQVENSLNVLQAPPRPTPPGAAGASSASSGAGSDTGSQAALTRQLLDAVRGLLTAQNQLYTVYQNYAVVRMQLYRDLEFMPLDARGVWIDEYADPARLDGLRPGNGPIVEPPIERLAPSGERPALLPPPQRP